MFHFLFFSKCFFSYDRYVFPIISDNSVKINLKIKLKIKSCSTRTSQVGELKTHSLPLSFTHTRAHTRAHFKNNTCININILRNTQISLFLLERRRTAGLGLSMQSSVALKTVDLTEHLPVSPWYTNHNKPWRVTKLSSKHGQRARIIHLFILPRNLETY